MRYDAEHKQKTREKVLSLAGEALRTDGPEKLGVAAIMAKAGLTHGGFYAHFASKDELIAETIGQFAAIARKRFDRETEGRSPAEGLGAYIDFYVSAKHRDSRGQGCPLPSLAGDMARMEPLSRAQFGAAIEGITALIGKLLKQIGHADPRGAARSIVAEAVGAVALSRAVEDQTQSNAILSAARKSLRQRAGLEA